MKDWGLKTVEIQGISGFQTHRKGQKQNPAVGNGTGWELVTFHTVDFKEHTYFNPPHLKV